ncbi:MAG: hypothetical protein R6U88_02730 [Candidatus Bipolaricaulota bacterium]
MNPLSLLLLIGVVGLAVAGAMVALSTCSEVTEHVLVATVVDMESETQEKERTVTVPGCPACPGSEPQTITQTYTEVTYYVHVVAEDEGQSEAFNIPVTKREYDALSVGDTVQLWLTRSTRNEMICSGPRVILEGASAA